MDTNIKSNEKRILPSYWPILILSFSLFIVSFVSTSRALESENGKNGKTESPGLVGVLMEYVPEGLTYEDFESLGPNWEAWSEEVTNALEELYESEELTLERQGELLSLLERKIQTMDNSLLDSDYSMIHTPLAELRGRLSRRVNIARDALAILSSDVNGQAKQKSTQLQPTVLTNVNNLRSYLTLIKNGSAWVKHLKLNEIKEELSSPNTDSSKLIALLTEASQKTNPYAVDGKSQVDFVSRTQLVSFRDSIVEYNKALTNTSKQYDWTPFRVALSDLMSKVETFEENESSESSAAVRMALAKIQNVSPVSSNNLSTTILRNYMNYNFRTVASESFLQRMISEPPREEQGSIRDCVLGARVSGSQCTVTDMNLDFQNSNSGIRFNVDINGRIHARTTGVTSQATVWTTGNHTFFASKAVNFDGNNFSTEPASIHVNANNNITNARIHHRGLITALFHLDDYALKKAREMRGKTEAIARKKVSDKVLPRLDSETDAEFLTRGAELNTKVYEPLKQLGLYPDVMAFRSTDSDIRISSRLMKDGELAASRSIVKQAPSNGASVQIHESWMNNSIDRMELAGKTMTETEVRDDLKKRLEILMGRPVEMKETDKEASQDKLVFHDSDPIRFKVSNGQLILIIQAGLKRPGKDLIPTQKITVPISLKLDAGKIYITRGDVSVEPVADPPGIAEQVIRARIMVKKIEESFSNEEKDAAFTFKGGKRDVNLTLTELIAANGWLVMSVE